MFRRVSIYLAAPAALLAGAVASPAFGDQLQVAASAAPDAAAVADQAQKKVVCRTELQTGTRFSQRKCATKLAWDKQEEEAHRAAHENFDRATVETRQGN